MGLSQVRIIKQHKTTTLFILFALFAGIINLFTRSKLIFVSSLVFCINATIMTGLILFWIHTIRKRVLPSKVRSYLVLSGAFMLLYYLLRVFKYRPVVESVLVNRYCTYSYFIPILMTPAFIVLTAVELSVRGRRAMRRISAGIVISVALIAVMALTNDLHFWVYKPSVPLDEFMVEGGTYSWGPGFCLIYGWIILNLFAAFLLLFKVMRKNDRRIVIMLVVSICVWLTMNLVYSLINSFTNLPKMYSTVEINIFSMILIAECCIRSRLIPHNENYSGFLSKLKAPLLIADSNMHVVQESAVPISASKEILMSSGTGPVYLDPDTRLSRMKIPAGYVFWTENERELHQEQKRLAEANEILSEENELIEVENKLKEQKARLDAQNHVYDRIAEAIFPKQKKIEELLSGTSPDDESFAATLGLVCVYNAYSKRKTNLLLLSEETLPKRNRELFLALSETVRFLNCCGIDGAAIGEDHSEIPLSDINDLYDTFETVVETYLPFLKKMTVSLMADGIRIAMEASEEQPIPETVVPVDCKESDGLLFITIRKRKAGDGK